MLVASETRATPCCVVVLRDATERKQAEQSLRAALDRLEQMANTDALTGLANRRHFDECMRGEWRRCSRQQLPLSLLIIDADNFKSYNDLYGHLAGDHCLKAIAAQVSAVARRPGDLAARYGGEEFALLLPETGQNGALHMAQQLCTSVQTLEKIHDGNPPTGKLSVSIGLATCIPNAPASPCVSADELLLAADKSLYKAKRDGRNRVAVAE
jgi:diguanylate cyclase (GGDEF)-like protein